jgi:hypothetical protein
MAEFAETLQKAEGLLAERPLRTTLTQQEVDRLADLALCQRAGSR